MLVGVGALVGIGVLVGRGMGDGIKSRYFSIPQYITHPSFYFSRFIMPMGIFTVKYHGIIWVEKMKQPIPVNAINNCIIVNLSCKNLLLTFLYILICVRPWMDALACGERCVAGVSLSQFVLYALDITGITPNTQAF